MNAIDRDDTEKKIAEIREALEKATPGPWEYEMWEGCADVYPTTGRHVPICQLWTKTEEPMENAENNARLIANAPEWLRFLLSELERKDEVIEEQKRQLFYKSQEITELREKSWQDQQWFKQASANITEMQKELDRIEREYALERAAHNAHVTELCELEKENRKMREELDAVAEGYRQQVKLAGELMDKLVFAQKREQRLIKKLREITKALGGVTFTDGRQCSAYNALCDIVEDIEKELSK